MIYFQFEGIKSLKNSGLAPCDFINFKPKFAKNTGLTPCGFLNLRPKFDKTAGLYYPMRFVLNFRSKFKKKKTYLLTPCDFINFKCKLVLSFKMFCFCSFCPPSS